MQAPVAGARVGSSLLDKDVTFADECFGLDARLTKAAAKLGFVHPTLVQTKLIPLALQGRDCLVRARTGSGKTLAYVLPVLHKLLKVKAGMVDSKRQIRAVVLVPSKELCVQASAPTPFRGALRSAPRARPLWCTLWVLGAVCGRPETPSLGQCTTAAAW